jgi:hypothetical protein
MVLTPSLSPGPPPAEARRLVDTPWFACGALLLVSVLAALHTRMPAMPLFPLDDAYIVQHSARTLLLGSDTTFADTSALTGSTSFLHLLLVTVFAAVLPTGWAAWSVSWLGIALLVTAVCRLARVARLPWYLAIALLAVATLAADASYQLLNGIETGLCMAAVVWILALHADRTTRHSWLVPVGLGVLPLVRPELALLSLLLWVERGLSAPRERRVPTLLREGSLALLVASPALVTYWVSTGSPLPRTMAAKRDFFAEACQPLAWKLRIFGTGVWEFALGLNAAALGLLALLSTQLRRVHVLFSLGFGAAYVHALPGAVYHNDHRYLYPFLALSVVGFALAWAEGGPRPRMLLGGALLVASFTALLGLRNAQALYANELGLTVHGLAGVADYVRANVPAEEPLLVHDIGFLSEAVANPLLDVVGLKNTRAAALQHEQAKTSCGHDRGRVFAQLAVENRARYFVVFSLWDQIFGIAHSLRTLGWTLEPLREPDVPYQVYRLTPP